MRCEPRNIFRLRLTFVFWARGTVELFQNSHYWSVKVHFLRPFLLCTYRRGCGDSIAELIAAKHTAAQTPTSILDDDLRGDTLTGVPESDENSGRNAYVSSDSPLVLVCGIYSILLCVHLRGILHASATTLRSHQ